jgi:hypothetical protein
LNVATEEAKKIREAFTLRVKKSEKDNTAKIEALKEEILKESLRPLSGDVDKLKSSQKEVKELITLKMKDMDRRLEQ